MAKTIKETYNTLGIPDTHIYPFGHPAKSSRKAHVEGISSTHYREVWIEILRKEYTK